MSLEQLTGEIAALQATVANLLIRDQNKEAKIQALQNSYITGQVVEDNVPILPNYTTEGEICLEPIRSLPEFNGVRNEYRTWKTMVKMQMESIERFKHTNTYATALAMIRHKIRGPASEMLVTHNTTMNIESIFNRLDYAYSDQRPTYILMDEMRRMAQGSRTLSEHYDQVNKILNLVLTQYETKGKGQEALMITRMTMDEAIRAFITGIRNKYVASAVMSQCPKSLETAYCIADTITHDYELINDKNGVRNQSRSFRPDVRMEYKKPYRSQPRPVPMDIEDSYRNFRQPQRFQPQHYQQPQRQGNPFHQQRQQINSQFNRDSTKREHESSRNHINPNKIQRVNQLTEDDSLLPEIDEDEYETRSSFLRRIKDLPCLQLRCPETNIKVNILIDTGATKNYISDKCEIGYRFKVTPFVTKTLHGTSEISRAKSIIMFAQKLIFYETSILTDFDLILGEDGLRKIKANIDTFSYIMTYKIKKSRNEKINFTIDNKRYEQEIKEIMLKNQETNPVLPFTSTIEATIRTKSEDPIWTKQYPYPYADNEFINKEIDNMLENGIIQKSRSPYNSPIWTVPKKGTDDQGKPKRRMVVDFQKLNTETITDRYPIPDVNMTIQNLGKAKYFTTLDLESGFHQIKIKKEDREKTAFSINGAKYEFLRMPFGLKNAPSIFQRCVDDILRPYIGKFAYVYIDDVLIYSSSAEEHMKHIKTIVDALHQAHMKISDEKSHFFKEEVEYLGHIIKQNRITVDPQKIETKKEFPEPKTLKELRSFLGLASYYRKFIEGFAQKTKPLTTYLRGEHGGVPKNRSAKIQINLNQEAVDAMNIIKNALQQQVELFQPDFNKPFELTTDASNFAIGAVLSQFKKPISFISRTLNETEQKYSTNEKELLAIVWALQKLRNYLYGIADLTIYTDHQSLIFSISEKNPNTKLKRWKNFIEEYGAKLVYKPGSQNVVADALSRQQINHTTDVESQHSQGSSPVEKIKRLGKPLNEFRTQIILIKKDTNPLVEIITDYPFTNIRHTIYFSTETELIDRLKKIIEPKHVNAIYTLEENKYLYEKSLTQTFPAVKFIYTNKPIEDIYALEKQNEIIESTHRRAHRNARNNAIEILTQFYWPKIHEMTNEYVKTCEICKKQKYERKPNKIPYKPTPIPNQVGKYIHMDTFHMNNNYYITAVDKYSKYLYMRLIPDKRNFHVYIDEILSQIFPNATHLMTDNESTYIGASARAVYQRLYIEHTSTPIQHSTSNGQIERAHSTIIEITRALAEQSGIRRHSEVIFEAIKQYNRTIHSVTQQKPEDVFFNQGEYPDIKEKLQLKQDKDILRQNKNTKIISYKQGDIIYVKTNRREKTTPKYKKYIVQTDNGNTVKTTSRNIIHKNNIRTT